MDIAPISLVKNENDEYPFVSNIECDMPTYGELNFKIFNIQNNFFLQYLNYPIVNCVANSNLYKGIHSIPFEIRIVPTLGKSFIINQDTINTFFIGVLEKK